MSYEESKKTPQKIHNLVMEDRKRLAISAVEDVDSFDDTQVIMRTACGELVVKGSELQIDTLSVDTGDVVITGTVTGVNYEEIMPSGSLWAKLFR